MEEMCLTAKEETGIRLHPKLTMMEGFVMDKGVDKEKEHETIKEKLQETKTGKTPGNIGGEGKGRGNFMNTKIKLNFGNLASPSTYAKLFPGGKLQQETLMIGRIIKRKTSTPHSSKKPKQKVP